MVNSVSIGTYNIQKPDGNWPSRRQQISHAIHQADLDIVCLQELSDRPDDKSFFSSAFKAHGYEMRSHSEKAGKTSVGILWRTARFDLVKSFTKNYETIDGGRACKRCFSAVDLRDKRTGKVIRVASVHLYTEPREAGQPYLGLAQLDTFKKQLEREPGEVSRVVIAGDFNADIGRGRGDEVLSLLLKPQEDSKYAYSTVAHDNFKRKITTKGGRSKIDWIFAGHKHASLVPKMSYRPVVNDPTASDHAMHAVDLSYEDAAPGKSLIGSAAAQPVDPQVALRLRACFQSKAQLVRDDLIRAGLVTRATSNQLASEWAAAGLLTQVGRGKSTYYLKGKKLEDRGTASIASSAPALLPIAPRRSQSRSGCAQCLRSLFRAIGDFFRLLASLLTGRRR